MVTQTKKYKSLQDLQIWEKAVQLAMEIYKKTASFPEEELFGISQSLRMCGIDVATAMARGHSLRYLGPDQYKRNLIYAMASLAKLETLLEIAQRLQYLAVESEDDETSLHAQLVVVRKQTAALIRRLNQKDQVSATDSSGSSEAEADQEVSG